MSVTVHLTQCEAEALKSLLMAVDQGFLPGLGSEDLDDRIRRVLEHISEQSQ